MALPTYDLRDSEPLASHAKAVPAFSQATELCCARERPDKRSGGGRRFMRRYCSGRQSNHTQHQLQVLNRSAARTFAQIVQAAPSVPHGDGFSLANTRMSKLVGIVERGSRPSLPLSVAGCTLTKPPACAP